ncbi:transient receptor potential cation channel subfamily A member 1-like [Acropora palmata]|uniref:transient receptor potential cation channel subfamily A member 1-like n=1 Tax=Acropora palmata TaxID=6131 RepID=UPI003D9FF8DE
MSEEEESPSSVRKKLISETSLDGSTCLDDNVEMDTYSQEKPEGFHKNFHRMLSTGQGVSVLEAVQQECLKEGGSQLTSSTEEELFNATDSDGCTLLHHAARCNKSATINILLDVGNVDIDQVQNMGFTALHLAVRHKSIEALKLLLKRGADPNKPDNDECTPLLFASRRGYTEIADILLSDERIKVNYANLAKITPLLAACAGGSKPMCEMLIAHNADITTKSSNMTTALHYAAFSGHAEICELLITTAKKLQLPLKDFLEERNVEDSTALYMSCFKGYTGVAKLLLQHGVDYEAVRGVNLSTPLHLTAFRGHEEMTRLLISSGAMVDSKDGHLQTPLHQAAKLNHTKIAEVLLENGASIEAKNMMDMTPFLIAVAHGAKETVEVLLDRGADLFARDSFHNSGLHLAVMYKRKEMIHTLLKRGKEKLVELRSNDLQTVIHLAARYEEPEILNILEEKHCYSEQQDIHSKIPLHHAAENGSLECIKALWRCSQFLISLNDRDDKGKTPLHLAASNNHVEAFNLLLAKGGDVGCQDHQQSTALHLAVQAGALKIVRRLLNPMLPNTLEIKDADQNTPVLIACMHNRLDILKLLLDKGADVSALNKDCMSCLDVAVESDSIQVARTLVKHDRWKEVVHASSKDQIPAMEKLIQTFPEVAEIVLDQCITYDHRPINHLEYTVTFNFKLLDPFNSLSSDHYFFGPGAMATYRRERLLNHSVTQALLRWKWLVLGKYLNYFNFATFLAFLVMFSYFIVDKRSRVRLTSNSGIDKGSDSENSSALQGVVFAFVILSIMSEIIQLAWLRLNYFKEYSNLLDLAMEITALIYILPYVTHDELYGNAQVQWTAGTWALLLTYINCILSLRRVSGVAIYISMYVEVFLTFIKVIAIFTVFLIGYALVFHVLLIQEDNFSSVWISFVKTVVMMVGEMDYSDLLSSYVVNSAKVPGTEMLYVPLPVLSHIMFMLFVLSVSIILMNLLVGLAVGDIDSIQKTATLRNLIDQATVVDDIQRRYPKWILKYTYQESLVIKPNQNRFLKMLQLSGSGITDSGFLDSLRKEQSSEGDGDQDLDNYEEQRYKKQEKRIKNLQATVDAQTELLKAIADKLQIEKR